MLIYAFRLAIAGDDGRGSLVVLSAPDVHDAYEHAIVLAATVGMPLFEIGKPSVYCFGSDEVEDNCERAAKFASRWSLAGYTVVVVGAVHRWREKRSKVES